MRSRRDTELFLLLAAAPAVVLFFVLVHGAQGGSVAWGDIAIPVGLLACFLGAHVAARYLARGADPSLLPIAFLLTGIGLATITRLDAGLAASQVLWVLAGVVALVAVLAAGLISQRGDSGEGDEILPHLGFPPPPNKVSGGSPCRERWNR